MTPDAVVVGAGPNGLVAAVTLALAGRQVLVVEAADRPGGGSRSEELTLPGVIHDVCSAIHPLGVGSPALRELPLGDHGLAWVHPDVPLAHPLDGGRVALLRRDVDDTAAGLGRDAAAYRQLFEPMVRDGLDLTDSLLSPLTVPPRHPIALARYGIKGIVSSDRIARRSFETDEARGLFAGLSAHSVLSLGAPVTAGYGILLALLGHVVGWPMAAGGSQRIADALVSLLEANGGRVECGNTVRSLGELPPARSVVLDLTPRQVLSIAGDRLPQRYARALRRFRHGPGVYKLDWALDGPIPWTAAECSLAGTVHLGGTYDEVAAAEEDVQQGRHPERPLVLLAQQTLFDHERAPPGIHTAWAYCHVPFGSDVDMTDRIESQVERFAPGFRDRVLARSSMPPAAVEAHNPNCRGGDITGGMADFRQFIARPVFGLHPWATPVRGLYLCSSSTPPGAGVHGMCGWHAAQEVLRRDS